MFMLVKIELQNFSLWKSIWDKEKTVRESYGCLSEKYIATQYQIKKYLY